MPRAVLLDLLMATMDSVATWTSAAGGDRERGLAWRDAVTRRMIEAGRYVDYDGLVDGAAFALGLPPGAPSALRRAWSMMQRWPDATALEVIGVPYAFVTNTSRILAEVAVERSGLEPAFTLSAEEAGWFKPRPEIYALAVEWLGLEAEAVRFVAGAAYDARGASDVGLDAVLVARRSDVPVPDAIPVAASLHDALMDMVRVPG